MNDLNINKLNNEWSEIYKEFDQTRQEFIEVMNREDRNEASHEEWISMHEKYEKSLNEVYKVLDVIYDDPRLGKKVLYSHDSMAVKFAGLIDDQTQMIMMILDSLDSNEFNEEKLFIENKDEFNEVISRLMKLLTLKEIMLLRDWESFTNALDEFGKRSFYPRLSNVQKTFNDEIKSRYKRNR